MTTTSTAFDADAVGVAALQLARVLLAISIVDIFLKIRESKDEGEQEEEDDEERQEEDAGSPRYVECKRLTACYSPMAPPSSRAKAA